MSPQGPMVLPKISIVTPVYNTVRFIEGAILSVLNQNCERLEYIVIDGGSTDGTSRVIEKYADQIAYFVSEEDQGQSHALNKGFARATGTVFGWLNADERYLPGALMEVSKAFAKEPWLDFFFGRGIVVDENGQQVRTRKWTPMHPKWHLLYKMQVLPTHASFWSARVHRLTGKLDEENFPRLCMDYDWLLRLSFHVKKWKSTSKYLAEFTSRPDGATRMAKARDPGILQKSVSMAHSRVILGHNISKSQLVTGLCLAATWERLVQRRFSIPHIRSSLAKLLSAYRK